MRGTNAGHEEGSEFGHFWGWFGVLLVLLGGTGVIWVAQEAEQTLRQVYRSGGEQAAEALEASAVRQLIASGDPSSPSHRRLKTQLVVGRLAYPEIRAAYLVGRSADGTLQVLVDSGSHGGRPEVPAYLQAAITAGAPAVLTGQGVVSVVAPVQGDATLVIEVDGSVWRELVLHQALPLGALVLMMTLILVLALLGKKRAPSDWRVGLILAFTSGLSLTVYVALMLHDWENSERKEALSRLATEMTDRLTYETQSIGIGPLENLAKLYEIKNTVTVDEFRQYASKLARDKNVIAWIWTPSVTSKNRESYSLMNSVTIWKYDKNGSIEMSSDRATYYPILHAYSEQDVDDYYGFDVGSVVQIAESIDSLDDGKRISVSRPFDFAGRKVIAIVKAVETVFTYEKIGYVLAIVDVDSIANFVSTVDAYSSVFVMQKDGALETLFSHDINEHDEELYSIRPTMIFDQIFIVSVYAKDTFMHKRPVRVFMLAALCGLFITLSVCVATYGSIRRNIYLRNQVLSFKSLLNDYENELTQLFDKSPLACLLLDHGTVVDSNRSASVLLKLQKAEITNRAFSELMSRANSEQHDEHHSHTEVMPSVKMTFRMKDGTCMLLDVYETTIKNAGNTLSLLYLFNAGLYVESEMTTCHCADGDPQMV